MSSGDDVLVTGAGGGVGIQHGADGVLVWGARIAAHESEEKLTFACHWGADEVIDVRTGGIAVR